MSKSSFTPWICAGAVLVLCGAGQSTRDPVAHGQAPSIRSEAPVSLYNPEVKVQDHTDAARRTTGSGSPLYHLNWYSVNGGGATNVNGTNFDLGLSVGQAAAGYVNGTTFDLGVGYWYGAAGGGACPIALSGDLNLSTTITSSDIIVLVNYVFKGGAAPLPCAANGDVNCGGTVTSSDIIVLVNYVFKGGAPPCDVCTIIPSLWSCP